MSKWNVKIQSKICERTQFILSRVRTYTNNTDGCPVALPVVLDTTDMVVRINFICETNLPSSSHTHIAIYCLSFYLWVLEQQDKKGWDEEHIITLSKRYTYGSATCVLFHLLYPNPQLALPINLILLDARVKEGIRYISFENFIYACFMIGLCGKYSTPNTQEHKYPETVGFPAEDSEYIWITHQHNQRLQGMRPVWSIEGQGYGIYWMYPYYDS